MSKCIRCGGSFLTRRKIKLKDAEICGKCYKELGFDNPLTSDFYKWEDIKGGRDAYRIKQAKEEIKKQAIANASISMAHYGEERDLICTEQERKMFDVLKKMMKELGYDDSPLQLVRVSDSYVTAKIEPWDVARIKFTPRAKWILFPTAGNEKHQLKSPEDVLEFGEQLQKTVDTINKYSDSPVPRL